jgi:hypothetical protein
VRLLSSRGQGVGVRLDGGLVRTGVADGDGVAVRVPVVGEGDGAVVCDGLAAGGVDVVAGRFVVFDGSDGAPPPSVAAGGRTST